MIDDREGLYSHTSDAIRDGKLMGRHDFFVAVKDVLAKISTDQEADPSDLGTRGFHVAQSCLKALHDLKKAFDGPSKRPI